MAIANNPDWSPKDEADILDVLKLYKNDLIPKNFKPLDKNRVYLFADRFGLRIKVGVHGFKGSEVQGSILVPELHLECVFMRKASSSSGLIQNLETNWQLLGKMIMFNEDFGSSMLSFSLTLNVEP